MSLRFPLRTVGNPFPSGLWGGGWALGGGDLEKRAPAFRLEWILAEEGAWAAGRRGGRGEAEGPGGNIE